MIVSVHSDCDVFFAECDRFFLRSFKKERGKDYLSTSTHDFSKVFIDGDESENFLVLIIPTLEKIITDGKVIVHYGEIILTYFPGDKKCVKLKPNE